MSKLITYLFINKLWLNKLRMLPFLFIGLCFLPKHNPIKKEVNNIINLTRCWLLAYITWQSSMNQKIWRFYQQPSSKVSNISKMWKQNLWQRVSHKAVWSTWEFTYCNIVIYCSWHIVFSFTVPSDKWGTNIFDILVIISHVLWWIPTVLVSKNINTIPNMLILYQYYGVFINTAQLWVVQPLLMTVIRK